MAVARTFSICFLVGGFTSFLSYRIAYCGFCRDVGMGFVSMYPMPCAQLKNPLMTAQCTLRLLLSPVRNGSDMRDFITRSVEIAVRSKSPFFSHQSMSFCPMRFGFVLVSLFFSRNSSHSLMAASTVTPWRTVLPWSRFSKSFSSFLALVWAPDHDRVLAVLILAPL